MAIPRSYLAFFDVDGTLIHIKSMFSFLRYYWRRTSKFGFVTADFQYYRYLLKTLFYYQKKEPREFINQKYYEFFANTAPEELMSLGRDWWKKIAASKKIYNDKIVRELKFHQSNGAEIVLVSGSMPACISMLAQELKVRYCLLTSLEVKNGRYTGKIEGIANINQGKRKKITNFLNTYPQTVHLSACFAYGDHSSDLPMLEMVGNPVVVGKDQLLVKIARSKGWKIIN